MKSIPQVVPRHFRHSVLRGLRGFMRSLAALGILLAATAGFAQSVSMSVTTKNVPDAKLQIKGSVSAAKLLPKGQMNVRNDISILFEYIEAGGKYRVLPESLWIRHGPTKGGKVLTKEEQEGVKAHSTRIWGRLLDNQKDEGKSFPFDKTIPIPEKAVSFRIVAFLNHMWSGTWPAWAYRYDIYAPNSVGRDDSGTDTETDKSKLETIRKLKEELEAAREQLRNYKEREVANRRIMDSFKKRIKELEKEDLMLRTGGAGASIINDMKTVQALHKAGANWNYVLEALEPQREIDRLNRHLRAMRDPTQHLLYQIKQTQAKIANLEKQIKDLESSGGTGGAGRERRSVE